MKFFDIKKSTLIDEVKRGMANDVVIWQMMLDVYNRYQEDERDGVDYIFDLNKQEDLVTLVKGGMTYSDICYVKSNSIPQGNSVFIHFGCNYPKPFNLTTDVITNNIIDSLNELIDEIVAYPWVEEYRKVYTFFITNKIIEDYE